MVIFWNQFPKVFGTSPSEIFNSTGFSRPLTAVAAFVGSTKTSIWHCLDDFKCNVTAMPKHWNTISCLICLMGILGTILLCTARRHFRAPHADWQMRYPGEEGHDKSRNVWHHSDAPPSPSPRRKTGSGQQMQDSGNHRLRMGLRTFVTFGYMWELYKSHFLECPKIFIYLFLRWNGSFTALLLLSCTLLMDISKWPASGCLHDWGFSKCQREIHPVGCRFTLRPQWVFPWNLDNRTDVNLLWKLEVSLKLCVLGYWFRPAEAQHFTMGQSRCFASYIWSV